MEEPEQTRLSRITCNFHRQLLSIYRQKTCLFIEKFFDPLFIKTHPFIKFGEKFQLHALLRLLLYTDLQEDRKF